MPPTRRYKWTNRSTKLLLAVWSNNLIQNHMRATSRPQSIWDGMAKFLNKRGYPVTGSQCRTRIKNMTSQYQEAMRTGDRNAMEPYFETFSRVLSDMKKEPGNSTENSEELEEILESDGDCSQGYIEILEPEQETEEHSNQQSPKYSTISSESLEALIKNALSAQTEVIRHMLGESMRTFERIAVREREKLEAELKIETEHRRQLEVRLNRLMTRVDATTVPHLTYMGAIVAERELLNVD